MEYSATADLYSYGLHSYGMYSYGGPVWSTRPWPTYIVMAYIVMAYIVMAYIVMATCAGMGPVGTLNYAVDTSRALDNGPLYVLPGSHKRG